MAENVFDKWNKQIDPEQMKKDVEEVEKNGGGQYKEVPIGQYAVKIEKMEIKESSKGDPMFSAQFRILDGEYKNSCLFMNQVITKPFQIGIVNGFLRSLELDLIIEFNGNYEDYNNTILDIFEEVDKEKLELDLEYKERKGYPVYTVKEVYGG